MPLTNEEINFIGLNGISERPPAVRSAGQVDDMVGFLPTPADGLQSAPTIELWGQLDMTNVPDGKLTNSMAYIPYRDKQDNWYLILLTGNEQTPLIAWDLYGQEIETSTISVDDLAYLLPKDGKSPKESFVVTAFSDSLVLANKTFTIEQLPSTDITNKTLSMNRVVILQEKVASDGARTYSVSIDGILYSVSYLKNDNASLELIRDTLAGTLPVGTYTTTNVANNAFEVARVDEQDPVIRVSSPSYVQVIEDTVRAFSLLPYTNVAEGTILKVQPDVSEGRTTPYWVEYDGETWNEVADPTASAGFGDADGDTVLPVVLRVEPLVDNPTYSAQLTITDPQYSKRTAGDEESNPDPRFVTSQIIGLTVFEGRLGFVSPRGVDWSRINKSTDFYRETAVEAYDDDPISMVFGGSSQSSIVYEAIQFHDIVFVNTSTGKYTAEGGSNGFTPTNFKINRVSSLGGSFSVPSVTVEDKLYFGVDAGNSIQFREYQYGDDHIDVEPVDVTVDVPNLIPSDYDSVASFNELRMFAVLDTVHASGEENEEVAYCYRYDVDANSSDDKKTQSAWFKLKIPNNVGMLQADHTMWIWDEDGWASRLDLRNNQEHTLKQWEGCEKINDEWYVREQAFGFYGSRLNEDCELFGHIDDGGRLYRPDFSVDLETRKITFNEDYGVITQLLVGVPEMVSLSLPQYFVRDREGFGIYTGTTRLRSMEINSRNSGQIDVDVKIANRDPLRPTQVRSHSFGEDYELGVQQLDGPKSVSRSDEMPINNRSDGVTVEISSTSTRPLDIVSIGYNYRLVSNKRIR